MSAVQRARVHLLRDFLLLARVRALHQNVWQRLPSSWILHLGIEYLLLPRQSLVIELSWLDVVGPVWMGSLILSRAVDLLVKVTAT